MLSLPAKNKNLACVKQKGIDLHIMVLGDQTKEDLVIVTRVNLSLQEIETILTRLQRVSLLCN